MTSGAMALTMGCRQEQSHSNSSANTSPEHFTNHLEYRTQPRTKDRVSLIGFGCMRLPMREISETEEEIDQEAYNELIDYAIGNGINYFDTSPVYVRGFSERATGIALKRHPRDKYFIATKMSNFRRSPEAYSREGSIELYQKSFEELQVDTIDYYLLHAIGMGGMEDFNQRFIENGILDFLLEEREAGRIRNLGWSFHGDVAVFDTVLAMNVGWDFVQIQMNYLDWRHASGRNVNAEYLYGQLVDRNIPAIVMEPLLGGRLAKLNYFSTRALKNLEPESSIASWAFRFAGDHSNVLTVLSGMKYKEHITDNLKTYAPLKQLTQSDLDTLETVAQQVLAYPFISCTECEYCMPCPYGLDIPGIFAHYNRCINEGNYPKNLQEPNYAKMRRAFLVGYDRSVPKLRQASHCTGCRQCMSECPQRIRIPHEMQRIDRYVEELKQQLPIS